MSKELFQALCDTGYEPRSYSGRAMYGQRCIGVALDGQSALWHMAQALGLAECGISAPLTDSLGLGIIAYWPDERWLEDFNEGD